MFLRRMLHKDLPSVATLCAELGYPVSLDELTQRFSLIDVSSTHILVVAEDGRQCVTGFVHVGASLALTDRVRCEIMGLVVTARERRKGIGKRLVAFAEEWACGQGYERIRVRSQALREEAQDFYRELGFELKKIQNVFVKELPVTNRNSENGDALTRTQSALDSEI